MLRTDTLKLLSALVLGAGPVAFAHHTYTEYDNRQMREIQGTLREARWVNPHARLRVEVATAGGSPVVYEVETSPVNYFRRVGVPVDAYRVGDTVKVAGWPSRRSPTRMYGNNIQNSRGEESVLFQSKPRWAATAHGYSSTGGPAGQAPATRGPDSMFHVWSGVYSDPDAGPAAFGRTKLLLTPAAQRAKDSFDRQQRGTALVGCEPKGMPSIMNIPTPMEIVDRGDTILIRQEEYDTVRTVHLRGAADPSRQPASPVGYSTGRWEGTTLVVETSRINAKYLNPGSGVPLGKSARIVERFTPSADGNRLHYTAVVTDPEVLAAPAELRRSWVYVAGASLLPFNCDESQDKAAGN